MKSFFFAIFALATVAIISSLTNYAYAVQPDYDNMVTNTTFSSNYDRIFDGQKFVNYLSNNTANQIVFQSRNIVLKFDKNLCSFQLLNPITNAVSIPNYTQSLTIDGIEPVLSACSVTNYARTENGLSFTAMRSSIDGNISTTYVINAVGHLEWTYEIVNTNLVKTSKYGVIETCDNCVGTSLDNDRISFGDYIYDTKNRIHNTLKSTDNTKGDYAFVYEGDAISFGEKIIIDPGFDTGVGSGNDASVSITIGNNPNRLVIAHVAYGRVDPLSVVTAPQIGSTNFTLLATVNSNVNFDEHNDIWYLVNPPAGSQTINVAYNGVFFSKAVSAISLYNVNQNTPFGVFNTTGSAITTSTFFVNITPTTKGSFIVAVGSSQNGLSAPNKTAIYTGVADGAGDFVVSAQYDTSTFNVVNTFTWLTTINAGLDRSAIAFEVLGTPPNAVTDLEALAVAGTSVSLDWTQPALNNGILSGYQINFTTPWGNPMTIITNDTQNSQTAGTVSGLTELTPYSFRVSAWTQNGNNATGNIVNVTTLKNFAIGNINLTQSNTEIIPIMFDRNDINDTALFLNVTYSNTFNLACDFHYKFAQSNTTYRGLTNVTVDSSRVRSDFEFDGVNNEVIDTFCWDEKTGSLNTTSLNSSNSARYLITQTNFPLLQQIQNFTVFGVYGAQGGFGSIDLVVLVAIIISMVGLNRVTESVGGIFVVAIVGVLTWFEIIDVMNFIGAAVALAVMLIIGTTKKD